MTWLCFFRYMLKIYNGINSPRNNPVTSCANKDLCPRSKYQGHGQVITVTTCPCPWYLLLLHRSSYHAPRRPMLVYIIHQVHCCVNVCVPIVVPLYICKYCFVNIFTCLPLIPIPLVSYILMCSFLVVEYRINHYVSSIAEKKPIL